MYGHPQDCSDDFVYRRPCEFIPHVLWLLSESQDHRDCPCKPCHRATGRQVPRSFKAKMDEQAAALEATKLAAAATETKTAKKGARTAATAKKKTATAATVASSVASSPGSEHSTKTIKPSAAPKATKKATAAKTQQTPVPTPVVPPTPVVQPAPAAPAAPTAPAAPAVPATPAVPAAPARHPALNDEPTLFRRGEMVWYQQGPAWRIGLIRHVDPEPTLNYIVVPLGHALLDVADVPKQQSQMRPFLTFSVPAISIPSLQEHFFSQVNWQALMAEPAYAGRSEVIGLEASKLAALEIDGSWSTFNRLASGPKQPKNQSSYGGVFLGAEMIRLGDPVRPKDKNRGSLLEVTEISVTAATSVPNPSDPAGAPSTTQYALSFRGIEYEATLVPEHGRIAAQPEGTIFVKDTAFRTAAAKASGAKQKCVWTVSYTPFSQSRTLPCHFFMHYIHACERTIFLTKSILSTDQVLGYRLAGARRCRPVVRHGRAHRRDAGRRGRRDGAHHGHFHGGIGVPEQPYAERRSAQLWAEEQPPRDGGRGDLGRPAAGSRRRCD